MKGTQWLCGTNLWAWLPPGWLDPCTLGFPWAQGRICPTVITIADLPLLKARWACSVFYWCDHLAAIFLPSTGLEDIVAHIEALTKFTQQDLNGSQQSLSLLNAEMSLVRKAVLQNRMALDIITALQGGTCAIIQTECCVFMPDESAKVSSLLNHMWTQVKALSDPTPSLGDLINQWFWSWGSWWKKLLLILGIISICVFSCMCLYCYCCICLHCSQTAAKQIMWLSRVEKGLEYRWTKMLQPKFQMAVCLHKQLGINKPNLCNIHWALVGVREWAYNLMRIFSPRYIKWILNLVYWKSLGNNNISLKTETPNVFSLCLLQLRYSSPQWSVLF